MQHCFYSGESFTSASQDEITNKQTQGNNLYWPTFSTSGHAGYSYPSTGPHWDASEDLNTQHFWQWSQTQATLPPNYTSSGPPTPLPHPIRPTMDDDLEFFAEHFKQRRMKLGVTQADVGKALGAMMIPGVESLSQSTICRFESLTLSRTNMIALRPLLQIWLDRTEALWVTRGGSSTQELTFAQAHNDAGPHQGRRKRTCITDSERRALEAYFAVQPQPSSERIVQIASLLDLPKSVVRVWFCNQRQKQKRLKWDFENLRSRCVADPKADTSYLSR